MHRDFADWYRVIAIEPDEARLENRWSGIERVLEVCGDADIIELVRLYYGRSLRDQSFLDRFRSAFKDADSTFAMRSNDLELKVLAASTVMTFLDDEGPQVDLVALCVKCGDYQDQGKPEVLPELIARAKDYLRTRSLSVRDTGGVPPLRKVKKLSAEAVTERCSGSDLALLSEPMAELINGINSMIAGLANSAEKTMDALVAAQEVQQEELDILWWVFAEHSDGLSRRMSRLGVPEACILAAKELSDHTTRLPGVFSADAFLDKVLRAVRKKLSGTITIKDAVNAIDRRWREAYANDHSDDEPSDLSPVHLAILKSLETEGDEDWLPTYERAAQVSADAPVTPLGLASQFYDELILARTTQVVFK